MVGGQKRRPRGSEEISPLARFNDIRVSYSRRRVRLLLAREVIPVAFDSPSEDPAQAAPETDLPTPPPTDPATFELRLFDPRAIRIFRHAGVTRLTWIDERSW